MEIVVVSLCGMAEASIVIFEEAGLGKRENELLVNVWLIPETKQRDVIIPP